MPQIVETLQTRKFNTAIPGVYSDRSTATPTGAAVEQGVVGLISAADFTRLKPYTPTLVTSDSGMKALLPTWGRRYSTALWSPGDANEPDVGRPSQFYVVNAAPSTRGTLTLTNVDGDVLDISARIYGLDSNKIKLTLGSGTNKGQKLTLTYEDTVWITDDIGGDNILGIGYAGSEATTMTAAVHPVNGVTVAYTKTSALAAPATDSYAPDDMAFDGTVTVTLDQNPGTGVTIEVTVTGINKSTGAALVEVLSFVGDSGLYAKTTSGSFSAVTTIARTNSAGGWGASTTAAVSGNAFALPIASYPTVQSVIDRINTFSAATFSAVDAYGDATTRTIASMDITSAANIKGTVAYYKANLDFLVQAFGNDEADTPILPIHPSGLVIGARAEAASSGTATNFSTAKYLVGGAAGASTYSVAGTWDSALQSLREIDLNECWIDQHVTDGDTDGEGILARVLVEFDYRHGQGRRETHLHLATSAQPTKTIAKTTAININRDYATLYVNETKFRDENSLPVWFAPKYTALRMACAAAGLPRLGMSLTNKRMNVEDVRDGGSNWSYAADSEELVRASLCVLATDTERGGFKVVRWLSTYRASADPLRTQSSTVRAMNASVQDLRRFAAYIIGQTNYDGTAAALKAALISRLRTQRDEFRWIKSFNPSNLILTDAGTTFTLDATNINPVEPVDFVYLRPEFSRTVVIL